MNKRFLSIINSEKPVLVDFYTEWCAPCKTMNPILKQLKDCYKEDIKIIKVNVDRYPFIATEFQIKTIPTFILFKKGDIKWRATGTQSYNDFYEALYSSINTAS